MRENEHEVLEGALICPARECQREHPIIDGIPIIVADIRGYVTQQLAEIRAREDLSGFIESLLGDCAGSGSDFDRVRYHLSSYAHDHWSDLDPAEPLPPGDGVLPLVERALGSLETPPAGVWIDLGCSLGRSTFELARSAELVLGIDLGFAMLRAAARIARTQRVSHPLRRVGMVYDRREFAVSLPARERVDFWACDATALPFADGGFDGALSLNLVDSTASPAAHLIELGRVLRGDAPAVLATPYDWSANATPVEGWLGGHSQRTEHRGSSVAEMRRLLGKDSPPELGIRLDLIAEVDDVPWRVYVHERATMLYRCHLITARARGATTAGES